jgi:hypothetical protein
MAASWDSPMLFHLPYLNELFSEWAAVVPLVCHLASYKRDHELVGQLALNGRLPVDIFPKLGFLYSLSKLLKNNVEFIDRASSKSSTSWRVWDVTWGSAFPCANGGASGIIMKHVLKRAGGEAIDMPDTLPKSIYSMALKKILSPAQTLSPAATLVPSLRSSATSSTSESSLAKNETHPSISNSDQLSQGLEASQSNGTTTISKAIDARKPFTSYSSLARVLNNLGQLE